MIQVIGIAGKMGVGKTSAAEVFEEYGYVRKSFATPLKWIATRYFFWDGEKDEKGRRLLQRLGTDVGREFDENVWIKHMEHDLNQLNKVAENMGKELKIVIDDNRFPNELEFVRSLGGTVIHLRSKGYDMGELNYHPSEQVLSVNTDKDIILSYPRFDSKTFFKEAFLEDLIRLKLVDEVVTN